MFIWRNRLTVVAAVLSCAPTAFGQVELDRFRRQLDQIQRDTQLAINHGVPATQRAVIDYGGYVTFNFLATDDINQKTHLLRETSLNGYTLINFDGAHELFARARSTYRDFNSGDGFSNQNDDWAELMLDRIHYKFNLKQSLEAYEGRSINGNLIIQGGRQLIHWANGLALSQEIDGGQITVESGRVSLETVVGVTRESTFDIDSSRPDFDGNTQRSFYGGLLSMQTDARHRPYIYGLFQRDRNDGVIASTDVLGTPGDLSDDIRTRFDYDSHYIGIGSTGSLGDRLTYGAEIVYQGGSSLSNSISALEAGATQLVQQQEQIEAFAVDLRLDYLMTDANRTRVSGEILIASGDTDRLTTTNTLGGNAAGSDDRAFNGFGLLNTGLAFNPNASNLMLFRIGASTFPLINSKTFHRLQVGTNLFLFHKARKHAPIDELTTDDRRLGFETDFYANWQATSDLALTIRYGIFFPGEAILTDHDARHFFFSGITLAF